MASGLLACFAGYRLFRFVLGVFGFLLGAFLTTSFVGSTETWVLVVAVIVGGIVGSIMMMAAYFMGVGLVGAGLASIGINVVWRAFSGGEPPPTILLVVVAVLGALGALSVAKYVVVFGTALAGSWTFLVGALALDGDPAAVHAATTGDIWVVYPLDLGPDRWWLLPAWFGLTLLGAIAQMASVRRVRVRRRRDARAT